MTARKSTGLEVAWADEPAAPKPVMRKRASELGKLASDPVTYVETLPAVKRGAGRRALNLDVPVELGDWFARYCREEEISQRDVLRALLLALRADVTG